MTKASTTARPLTVSGYFKKMRGELKQGPGHFQAPSYIACAVFGAFCSLGTVSLLTYSYPNSSDYLTPVGTMGAAAVLMFGAPASPFSQPRNAIGGQLIAATMGVICRLYIAAPMGDKGLALPLSVALTLAFQYLFRALNPPAGGTSAVAVISSPVIDRLGWGFLVPCLVESVCMVLVACLVINLHPDHSYPKYWFFDNNAPLPGRPSVPPEWRCGCCALSPEDPQQPVEAPAKLTRRPSSSAFASHHTSPPAAPAAVPAASSSVAGASVLEKT